MSFQEDILNGLIGTATYKVDVDREATVAGAAATKVTVHRADGREPHEFTFSKANGMSAKQMAEVIRSYLPEMK